MKYKLGDKVTVKATKQVGIITGVSRGSDVPYNVTFSQQHMEIFRTRDLQLVNKP